MRSARGNTVDLAEQLVARGIPAVVPHRPWRGIDLPPSLRHLQVIAKPFSSAILADALLAALEAARQGPAQEHLLRRSRRARIAGQSTDSPGGHAMPRFAANLSDDVQRMGFPRPLRGGGGRGLRARSNSCFPMPMRRRRSPAGWSAARLTQALFNLPPGNWEAGERGLACTAGRAGRNSAPRSTPRSPMPRPRASSGCT